MGLTLCLRYRSTSVQSDEALCLGVILDLDVGKIWAHPPEGRMKAFWDALPDIPPDVVFFDAPKIQQKGFRWAPATLFGGKQNTRLLWTQNGPAEPARLTGNGLIAKLTGFILSSDLADLFSKTKIRIFEFADQDDNRYWFNRLNPDDYKADTSTIGLRDPSAWTAISYSDSLAAPQGTIGWVVIILEFRATSHGMSHSSAILGAISKLEEYITFVSFIGYGWVHKFRDSEQHQLMRPFKGDFIAAEDDSFEISESFRSMELELAKSQEEKAADDSPCTSKLVEQKDKHVTTRHYIEKRYGTRVDQRWCID